MSASRRLIVFVHTNVTQHYATFFSLESLSLRRLCLIGVAFFESFITRRPRHR